MGEAGSGRGQGGHPEVVGIQGVGWGEQGVGWRSQIPGGGSRVWREVRVRVQRGLNLGASWGSGRSPERPGSEWGLGGSQGWAGIGWGKSGDQLWGASDSQPIWVWGVRTRRGALAICLRWCNCKHALRACRLSPIG